MRQKDDPTFFNMLNRIRVGSPSKEDVDLLKSNLIKIDKNKNSLYESAIYFQSLLQEKKGAVCLLCTNEDVEKFNGYMTKLNKIETIQLNSEDDGFTVKKNFKQKASETAGLEKALTLGIGSRVMLRRNIDVAEGMCNGAIGTVTDICYNNNNYVTAIYVKFDNKEETVKIKRIRAQFEIRKNICVTRRQFPLCLAWAITIHKCQGLSLDGKYYKNIK